MLIGRPYGRGMQRRNRGYCSLQQALHGFPSMDSKIYKGAMVHAVLQLKKPEMSVNFQKPILGIIPPPGSAAFIL